MDFELQPSGKKYRKSLVSGMLIRDTIKNAPNAKVVYLSLQDGPIYVTAANVDEFIKQYFPQLNQAICK